MRGFLAVLAVLCCITQIKSGEADKRDAAVEKKCKATYNVDDTSGIVTLKITIFIESTTGNDDDVIILKDEKNENHRCYVQCLLEGYGYIKDGELDQELVMQEMVKELKEKNANFEEKKLEAAIKSCAEKASDEKCDRTYQIAKCVFSVTG